MAFDVYDKDGRPAEDTETDTDVGINIGEVHKTADGDGWCFVAYYPERRHLIADVSFEEANSWAERYCSIIDDLLNNLPNIPSNVDSSPFNPKNPTPHLDRIPPKGQVTPQPYDN